MWACNYVTRQMASHTESWGYTIHESSSCLRHCVQSCPETNLTWELVPVEQRHDVLLTADLHLLPKGEED
jgi:hypothetical protein